MTSNMTSNMVPDYEVHLPLEPSIVLGPDYKLTPTVLSLFSMPTSVIKMNVQYLDTQNQDIFKQGWSPRIRHAENKKRLSLTYKKRYPISTNDTTGINEALALAGEDGFNSSISMFEAQVEVSSSKMTLSVSREKKASADMYAGVDLPDTMESRELLIDNAPERFDNWLSQGWGTDLLGKSTIYGPVLAERSVGTWNDTKVYIEVWPIKNSDHTGLEYTVEASFKEDELEVALAKRDALQSMLQSNGWFLPQDTLKTAQIMQDHQ